MNIAVDVFSDVICPWCYIGKRRLEKAIAALDRKHEVQVRWQPFQLNPEMPKEGISRKEYRIKKFGSWERSLELEANMISAGVSEDIHFAFGRIERTPNTLNAHRLIWLADQRGCHDAVVEALFAAYFTQGRDIGDQETLINIVCEAGLERQCAEAMLSSDDGMDFITKAVAISRQRRIHGVPFFIINNEITLSGAQEPQTFLDAFQMATVSM